MKLSLRPVHLSRPENALSNRELHEYRNDTGTHGTTDRAPGASSAEPGSSGELASSGELTSSAEPARLPPLAHLHMGLHLLPPCLLSCVVLFRKIENACLTCVVYFKLSI